jgi:endonuclease/exonuclease/phosphatase (EEP) superfamily protein YafD
MLPPPQPTPALTFAPPPPRTGGRFGDLAVALTSVTLAVIWGAALLGGLFPSLPPTLILVLTVLPWVAVALAAWCFLLWTILPDHRAAPWLLAASVLAPVVQWGSSWPDLGVEPAEDDLRVLTWNVRRLWGGPAKGDPVACVAAILEQATPDVVLLQEVTRHDLDKLQRKVALDCVHTTYRDADDADDAGVASCTRGAAWTLIRGESIRYVTSHDWQYILGTFERGGQRFNALSVHLHPYRILQDPTSAIERAMERAPVVAASQDAQIDALLSEVHALPNPTIVGGDFNSTRDTPFHARLRWSLVDAYEAGSQGFDGTVDLLDMLSLRVDYLYTPSELPVVDAEILQTGCSDHRPVVARLRILPATP